MFKLTSCQANANSINTEISPYAYQAGKERGERKKQPLPFQKQEKGTTTDCWRKYELYSLLGKLSGNIY